MYHKIFDKDLNYEMNDIFVKYSTPQKKIEGFLKIPFFFIVNLLYEHLDTIFLQKS